MNRWQVRREAPGDEAAISALTTAAFHGAAHSHGDEARIVERLRADGDLALSLVVKNDDWAIIGHVACSPVSISGGAERWYGLGPVSVIPLRQRAGIGTALIGGVLQWLEDTGAAGCVVLGDPAYYARFGFHPDPGLTLPGVPPEYFQRRVIRGPAAAGVVRYAPAFGAVSSA